MAKLITGIAIASTSVTFTTSQTWTSPVGITNLLTVVGKGQDGTAGTSDSYGASTSHSAAIDQVRSFNIPNTHTGAGVASGVFDWASFQNDAPNAAATINTGGTGTVRHLTFFQYTDSAYYTYDSVAYTNALPSSAVASNDATWQTSGPIISPQGGDSSISWMERGAFIAGTSPTTGSNTTGFGKTFTGGVGVIASTTSYSNVAITASTAYTLVVPTGGYITITY